MIGLAGSSASTAGRRPDEVTEHGVNHTPVIRAEVSVAPLSRGRRQTAGRPRTAGRRQAVAATQARSTACAQSQWLIEPAQLNSRPFRLVSGSAESAVSALGLSLAGLVKGQLAVDSSAALPRSRTLKRSLLQVAPLGLETRATSA